VVSFGDDACPEGEIRAIRTEETLRFMRDTLGHQPPDVTLTLLAQHYVLFPEHTGAGYPHNYANDAAIRDTMEQSPRRLVALSGHCHPGHPLTEHRGVTYFTGRALCERPYPFYVLHIEGPALRVEERAVAAQA
jgi:hypothetical protein